MMNTELLEKHNQKLQEKYHRMATENTRFENFMCDDAELVFVGYGIVSRMLQSAVLELRKQGKKVGLLRPLTLFPFPSRELVRLADTAKKFLAVELSNGQMVEDVRLAINGKRDVEFYGRMGGSVPSVQEIITEALKHLK